MKKLVVFLCLAVFMLSLTGCSKVKLEEDQSHITVDKKGEVTIEAIMSEDTVDDDFDIDLDDKEKDIEEDIIDAFDDMDVDVKIDKLKAKKDTLEITMTIEDGEDYGIDLDQTLEDYADDWGYDEVEDYADEYDFVEYKSGDDIKAKDMDDYADYTVVSIYGSEEGNYFTVPGKIVALSDIKYEEISSDTIFVEDGEYGIVIIK